MVKIRIPTFNELLARIDDWPTMTSPQLAAAIGAEEARDIFRQLAAKIAEVNVNTNT